jgi:membrane protein implicated in regulation of membrane protease activity
VYLTGPPWLYAFILAIVAGTLLAIGEYVGAAVALTLSLIVTVAWQRAVRRGEHQRKGIS